MLSAEMSELKTIARLRDKLVEAILEDENRDISPVIVAVSEVKEVLMYALTQGLNHLEEGDENGQGK